MGFWSRTFTWWNGATWGTALWTRRFGNEVGRDAEGNLYYQDKKRPWRRWVIYNGSNDGSRVPPGWQLWLRGTIARIAAERTPESLEPVPAGEPVAAVLEIAGGRAAELGIKQGDPVSWSR